MTNTWKDTGQYVVEFYIILIKKLAWYTILNYTNSCLDTSGVGKIHFRAESRKKSKLQLYLFRYLKRPRNRSGSAPQVTDKNITC